MDQKEIDSYLEKMSENRISFDVSGLPLQFRTSKNQFNSGLVTLNNHCKVLNKLNVKGFVTWIMPTNNELTYLKNQLPNDAKVYLSFEGSCFDLCFSIVPKDKDDRKYYKTLGFKYDYKD